MLKTMMKFSLVLLVLVGITGCSSGEAEAFLGTLNPEQRKLAEKFIEDNPGIIIPDDPNPPGDGNPEEETTPTQTTPPGGGGGGDPFDPPPSELDPEVPLIPLITTPDIDDGDPTISLDEFAVPEPATATTALVAGLVLSLRGRRRRNGA